jgi:hypothetical protein
LVQAGSTVLATRANPHHFSRLYSNVKDARPIADAVEVSLLSVKVLIF